MALASRRQQILVEMLSRVSAIKRSDGFNTDAGLAFYAGDNPVLGDDDPESAVAVILREEPVISSRENVSVRLQIEVQAIAKADVNQSWLKAEELLADIKKAVELSDRTLGGLTPNRIERNGARTLPRDTGATTVGASVFYATNYIEAWGNP